MVVLCLLEIKLPEVVTTVTGFGAAANTFLCMIMIGESINLSVTFKDLLYILKILAVRLVIQVGLALFFWYCLPWDYDVRRALVLVARGRSRQSGQFEFALRCDGNHLHVDSDLPDVIRSEAS